MHMPAHFRLPLTSWIITSVLLWIIPGALDIDTHGSGDDRVLKSMLSPRLTAIGDKRYIRLLHEAKCVASCMEQQVSACTTGCRWEDGNRLPPIQHDKAFPRSSLTADLLGPVVACQDMQTDNTSKSLVTVYLRVDITWYGEENASTRVIFVLSIQSQNEYGAPHWIFHSLVKKQFFTITHMHPNVLYRYLVTAVSSDGLVGREVLSDWVRTISNSSCYFEMHWMSPKGLEGTRKFTQVLWYKEYLIRRLEFGRNYSVRILAYNRVNGRESEQLMGWIRTLDCGSAMAYNFSVCAPGIPVNLSYTITLRRGGSNDVNITWYRPHHVTIQHDILQYTVKWKKRVLSLHHSALIRPDSGVTHRKWNETSALLTLDSASTYVIRINAVTYGGAGPYATLYVLQTEASMPSWQSGGLLIGLPVSVIVILAFSLLLVRKIRYRLARKRSSRLVEMNPLYLSITSTTNVLDGCDEYELDRDWLVLGEELGEGAFGKVMKGRLKSGVHFDRIHDGEDVAVKMLKDHCTEEDRRNLLLEISLVKELGSHRNIVSLLGCCTCGSGICLVMDYCALGDLRNYLRNSRTSSVLGRDTGQYTFDKQLVLDNLPSGITIDSSGSQKGGCSKSSSMSKSSSNTANSSGAGTTYTLVDHDISLQDTCILEQIREEDCVASSLSSKKLLSYAWQIAEGMTYMSQQRFVHRDLAARNVLLSTPHLVKISDFGLARDVYQNNIYQPSGSRRLPYKWMALEAIFDRIFTTKGDIWSFGVLLWEISTLGGCPYPGIPSKDLFPLLKTGYRMERPENCHPEVYKLMLSCWHPDPNLRPRFEQLSSKLECLLQREHPYIKLTSSITDSNRFESSSDSDL